MRQGKWAPLASVNIFLEAVQGGMCMRKGSLRTAVPSLSCHLPHLAYRGNQILFVLMPFLICSYCQTWTGLMRMVEA